MSLPRLFLLFVGLQLLACSPSVSSYEQTFGAPEFLIGGQPITEQKTEAAKSVVIIKMLDRSGSALGFCSGTLIGKNTVLTAGHCFDKRRLPTLSGFNIVFTTNFSYASEYPHLKGLKYLIPSDYNHTGEFDNDIAVASFAGTVPGEYRAVNIDTDTKTDHSSQFVYVYGFGRSQDYSASKNEPNSLYMGQLHRGVMQIDKRFDRHPDRYWTTPDVPVFICQGDSGGPQFYYQNEKLKVIGVNSAVYGRHLRNGKRSCRGIAQATRVAYFANWIRNAQAALLEAEFYH